MIHWGGMGAVAQMKFWEALAAHCGAPSSWSHVCVGPAKAGLFHGSGRVLLVGLESQCPQSEVGTDLSCSWRGRCWLAESNKNMSDVFWLSLICCRPAFRKLWILTDSLAWWLRE